MKEILDILVWAGFIFVLFIFIRGMNETQVQKHKDKLEQAEKKKQAKEQIEEEK